MKAQSFPCVPAFACWLAVLPIPFHASGQVRVDMIDAPGAGNRDLRLRVEVPPRSMVRLESNPGLQGPWADAIPEFPMLEGGELTAEVPMGVSPEFFRFVINPLPLAAESSGGDFRVDLDESMEVPAFVDLLNATTGQSVFPQVMDTSLFRDLGKLPPVPAGRYSVKNPEDLGPALGVPLWGVGVGDDDAKFSDTFFPTDFPQDGKNIPSPGGDGRMGPWDDGQGAEVPRGELLEPGKLDMIFEPEIPDVDGKLPLDDKDLVFPGHEARFFLHCINDGTQVVKDLDQSFAAVSEGSAQQPQDPPLPETGAYVYVVRDKATDNPDGIATIATRVDPFATRAYNPPEGGSHGEDQAKECTLGIAVPMNVNDPNDGLAGKRLEIYRYRGGLGPEKGEPDAQPTLSPEFFSRNEQFFEPVEALTEEEMRQIFLNDPASLGNGPRRGGDPQEGGSASVLLEFSSITKAPEVTELHRSGSNGSKVNVAIIGDGFRDTTGDQDAYNNYVQAVMMEDFLGADVYPEVLNAINVFRINTFSDDSGVTQVNSSGGVTTSRDTALEYRFSGNWSRCWMERGPFSLFPLRFGTDNLIALNLQTVCPQADIVFVVLNEPGFGGCAGGNRFAVTRGADWTVVAHEFGHLFGKLGDEYLCTTTTCSGNYAGSEPSAVNLTTSTTSNSVKWSEWIPSWRPTVTTASNVADNVQDVGIFRGATIGSNRYSNGLYRPTVDGRMRSNSPLYNPVGYTKVRDEARPFQEADLRKNVCGDFNGDGRTDLVLLDGRQLSLYLAVDRNSGANDPMTGNPPRGGGGVLQKTWFHTDRLVSDGGGWSWQIRPGDKLFAGDFDNDGDDDLYVFNGSNWNQAYVCMLRSEGNRFQPVRRYDANLPGWQMRSGDRHYVADINGDGRDDLLVYNGTNWNQPYFLLLRSNGTSLSYVRRYDRYLPGTWEMGRNERFFVGDFNGEGRECVIAQDRDTWSQVHLRVFTMNAASTALVQASRYYGPITGPGFTWNMNRKDDLHVADLDGDGDDDLALFNGLNWGFAYLGLFESRGGVLTLRRAYSEDTSFESLPGWQLDRLDRFHVSNVDGDGDEDLIVFNAGNWDTEYLGVCRSQGENFSLVGSWQKDWIGGWNLGSSDQFCVADFRGGAGWDDLFVFNKSWFGLLRSYQNAFQLESINWKWITQHRYHGWGIW